MRSPKEELQFSTSQHLDRLRQVPHQVARILQDYRQKAQSVYERWDLPEDLKRKGVDLVRADSLNALEAIEAHVRDTNDNVDSLIRRARRRSEHRDMAGELRLQAAWSRLRETLDAADGDLSKVQNVLERAQDGEDFDTLAAARRELPAYLERQGTPLNKDLTRWLDIVAGDDTVQAAVGIADEADRGVYRLGVAFNMARTELQGGLDTAILPGFTPGTPDDPDGELIQVPWDGTHPNDLIGSRYSPLDRPTDAPA